MTAGDPVSPDLREYFKTIEPRHLDIEKQQVGPVFLNRFDGLDAVRALSENLNVGFLGQRQSDALAGERFIIDDNGADLHGISGTAVRSGISISTATPPSGREKSSTF